MGVAEPAEIHRTSTMPHRRYISEDAQVLLHWEGFPKTKCTYKANAHLEFRWTAEDLDFQFQEDAGHQLYDVSRKNVITVLFERDGNRERVYTHHWVVEALVEGAETSVIVSTYTAKKKRKRHSRDPSTEFTLDLATLECEREGVQVLEWTVYGYDCGTPAASPT